MTIGGWLVAARAALEAAGIDSAKIEAEALAGHGLELSRSQLLARTLDPLPEFHHLDDYLRRRVSREPLAYILGWREFYGRRFAVDPHVLIPRQETEGIVDLAANLAGVRTVLDVGTGSGCLAITLALEHPYWIVTGLDLSSGALEVARSNAGQLGSRTAWVEGDLRTFEPDEPFDLLVSNPPYVAANAELDPEVRYHEPALALFADRDGYDLYSHLAERIHHLVRPGGTVILEVGLGQAELVARMFPGTSEISRDLAGIDRLVRISLPD